VSTTTCNIFNRSLQHSEVSSSDERLFGPEDNNHSLTRNVVMGTYNPLSPNCYSRIYSATFHSESGLVEVNYSLDTRPHCYDPKAFIIDGYFIATFCLPCEEIILKNVFDTEPYLSWKRNQISNSPHSNNNNLDQNPMQQ
jgi:hypothetical protein